jgi:SAM-dependent methyltransferase
MATQHHRPRHSTATDASTASAFATSWNNVGDGSVYTLEQFLDWLDPLAPRDFAGKTVLELGFGNGSLLYHMGAFGPARLCGVELGDTLEQTSRNLRHLPPGMVELHHGDLTQVRLGQFDLVYCIGVLHHLKDPYAGFRAVVDQTKPGGRFHCWVYGKEGNEAVIRLVEPIRRVASRLPWWLTKYGFALPLVTPYFVYAKALKGISAFAGPEVKTAVQKLPLGEYSSWIAERPFRFFHHVAFDQLVTPQTTYIAKSTIESWLDHTDIEPSSPYVIRRNGNSWKFGGRKKGPDASASAAA